MKSAKDKEEEKAKKRQAIALYNSGMRVVEIVGQLKISTATLYRWITKAKKKKRYQMPIDGSRILTEAQLRRALDMYYGTEEAPGLKFYDIAREFKVSGHVMKKVLAPYIVLNTREDKPENLEQARLMYDCIHNLLAKKMSVAAVAARLKIPKNTVYRVCPRRTDKTIKSKAQLRNESIAKYHKDHASSTFEETATHFGVCISTVKNAVYAANMTSHRVASAKKKERKQEASNLFEAGKNIPEIAEQMHCSQKWLRQFLPG